jgi:hypothetical protein
MLDDVASWINWNPIVRPSIASEWCANVLAESHFYRFELEKVLLRLN